MVCDLIRTCYVTDCRFWKDSEEVAKIRWYRAPVGAKVFPFPQRFNSLYWFRAPWEAEGVGEVWEAAKPYSNGATPPGVTGQAFYGPAEYFREGAPFDPGNVTPRIPEGPAVACIGCDVDAIADETGSCAFVLQEDGTLILLES